MSSATSITAENHRHIVALDPAKDLRGLRRFYERAEAILAWPREQLLFVAESVSLWSAGHHLFHIALANELALRNVRSLLERRGRLIRPFQSLEPLAVEVLRTGRHPRGVAKAPRMVVPPPQPDLGILAQLVAQNVTDLEALAPRLGSAELEAAPDTIPHQDLGDLTAAQWLRFCHAHGMHHLLIVRDIRNSTGFGAPGRL